MKLKELCKIKHGFAFKGKDIIKDHATKYVLVTPGNFNIGGGFKNDKCKYFSESGEIPRDYILKESDLIVTMTDLSVKSDTLGYSALVPKDDNNIYLHNQRIGLVHDIDESKVLKDYLYWFMRTKKYQQEVVASQSGTAIHHTSPDRILNIEIDLPSIDNQKRIVKLLNSIDEKIKLNNEINNNMSKLCNNIFHDYLDKYEDKIEYKKIVDIAEKVVTGKTPSTANKDFWDGTVPFITIPDMHNQIFTIKTERNITQLGAKSIIPKNSISVSCIATVGLVSINTEESQTNQQINSIVLNNGYDLYFLYEYLSEQEEFMKSIAGGSTTYNINKNTFENIEVPYLPKELLVGFNTNVCGMFEKIKNNQYENEELSQLRDTLLPKLMNGEIDLDNIEI